MSHKSYQGNGCTPIIVGALITIATLAAMAFVVKADAMVMCGTEIGMTTALKGPQYNEKLMVNGDVAGNRHMRFYSNPETGTWTIGIEGDNQNGVLTFCILATGTNMQIEIEGQKL